MTTNNPQMTEDELRERVNTQAAYCDQEVAVTRLRSWIEDQARDEALALGNRLWGIHYPTQPWFGMELMKVLRREFPEAHLVELPDGPVTCATEHADLVRELVTQVRRAKAPTR
jgi:hypothetical protein